MFGPVRQVLLGDATDERVTRVAVGQQRTDRQQHLGYRQRRRPVVLENVQTYGTLAVDVTVVDASTECHLE